MDRTSPPPKSNKRSRRIWPLVVGIVGFAALMGWRQEVTGVPQRAAMAGCAFVLLVWGVEAWRKPQG